MKRFIFSQLSPGWKPGLRSAVILMLVFATTTWGAIPKLINFQGVLRDGSGNPVADGSYSVAFKIYDAPSAGTLLWTETQSVATIGGSFNVLLGATNAVPDSAFSGANRYLGIAVASDPEMSPRFQLVSVGYAYRVNSVDGALGWTISGDVKVFGRATIGSNTNTGAFAFVAGTGNTVSGVYSSISGGDSNTASGQWATIGGGEFNVANAFRATVGGGGLNTAGNAGTVAGGYSNSASNSFSSVGGGLGNTASGNRATVGGGGYNNARGQYSVVSGGGGVGAADSNSAFGDYSAVGGGRGNIAEGFASKVGGGSINKATGSFSFVGGGINNLASGSQAAVVGGQTDTASAPFAAVGGGCGNSAKGSFAKAGGGFNNMASGFYSTIAGGDQDTATGDWAAIPGGQFNKAVGNYSFAAGRRAKALHHGSFVWADSTDADFSSTAPNQFIIRASGGFGIGTANPQGALDMSEAGGAFILPRMTTAQRNAMRPIDGMVIYNTETRQFNFCEDGRWVTKQSRRADR